MRIVRKVAGSFYVDNYKVVSKPYRVDDLVLEKSPSLKIPLDKYIGLLMESCDELEDTLKFSYYAMFRFYDNILVDTQYVWINRDAELDCFPHKERCFLGRWPLGNYSLARRAIRIGGGRNLIVRYEWIAILQEKFESFICG